MGKLTNKIESNGPNMHGECLPNDKERFRRSTGKMHNAALAAIAPVKSFFNAFKKHRRKDMINRYKGI